MTCWICEKQIESGYNRHDYYHTDKTVQGKGRFETKDTANYRCYCKECYEKHNNDRKIEKERYILLKKKLMFERALDLMEKQNCNMYEYRASTIKVQKYLYANIDKFDSADEIIAAIVLIHNGLQIIPQYKIGNYQVDFYIPSLKIVLEIDGELYHGKVKYRDSQRDAEIKEMLGDGWEIVRIGAKYIEQNCTKLLEAMSAIKKLKQAV